MINDIVLRLREPCDRSYVALLGADGRPRSPLALEAADEIERLREALEAVMAEYRDGYGLNCVDKVRAALNPSK